MKRTSSDRIKPPPDFRLHWLGDEALLFCPESWGLFHLNPAAAFICGEWVAGNSPETIAAAYERKFAVSSEEATAHVRRSMSRWTTISKAQAQRPQPEPQPSQQQPLDQEITKNCLQLDYELLGQRLRLYLIEPSLTKEIGAAMGQKSMPANDQAPDAAVTVTHTGPYTSYRSYRIEWIGGCETPVATEEIVPTVRATLIRSALMQAAPFASFHASALKREGSALLLAGYSGSGKSTLCAALTARDFRLLADEPAVMDVDLQVHRLGAGINLKTGSWDAVSQLLPKINDLPTYRRRDGQQVRILHPESNFSPPDGRTYPVRHIVKPSYAPKAAHSLSPISQGETLALLLSDQSYVPGHFNHSKLAKMVQWIGAIECWELRYSDLERAAIMLESLHKAKR